MVRAPAIKETGAAAWDIKRDGQPDSSTHENINDKPDRFSLGQRMVQSTAIKEVQMQQCGRLIKRRSHLNTKINFVSCCGGEIRTTKFYVCRKMCGRHAAQRYQTNIFIITGDAEDPASLVTCDIKIKYSPKHQYIKVTVSNDVNKLKKTSLYERPTHTELDSSLFSDNSLTKDCCATCTPADGFRGCTYYMSYKFRMLGLRAAQKNRSSVRQRNKMYVTEHVHIEYLNYFVSF